MELLGALMQLILVMFCAVVFVGVGLWLLFNLDAANHTVDDIIEKVYDHEEEGDFPKVGLWSRNDHHPEVIEGPESITLTCTCGEFSHTTPIYGTAEQAEGTCLNEFETTHIREVSA